ncbi:putative baseplate assembly protein [Myxococcota bacterium]|nr:putative baseplate assembly protein [Myxococcota bacterium]
MTFELPKIDDRSFEQIFEEARARIAVHNPEWTNHHDADPGITLLQLFAFITESMLYRANQVPERNRLRFLSLLGITRREAAPAQGFVTFEAPRGRLSVAHLSPGAELRAGRVPFSTVDGLEILPVEGRIFYKGELPPTADRAALDRIYRHVFTDQLATGEEPEYYETRPFEPPTSTSVDHALDLTADTVDDSAWIALCARSETDVTATRALMSKARLSIGLMPALRSEGRALGALGAPPTVTLAFELPANVDLDEEPGTRVASWVPIEHRVLGRYEEGAIVELDLPAAASLRTWTDLFPTERGTGEFPPALEDDALERRIVTWVRVRSTSPQVETSFGWIGVNAARVVQRGRVESEVLGRANGEPDQVYHLASTPVLAETVVLTVDGVRWLRTDALDAAPREAADPGSDAVGDDARVFTIDRASGEVRFGNGLHGARPPRGAVVVARYDFGGGIAGNVGIEAISSGARLPSGVRVSNPIPTWGGTEPESQREAERRIPATLRHRDRLVTTSDFLELVRATPGISVGRVEILPLFHPDLPELRSEGVVTIVAIPTTDRAQPEAPRPDRPFLDAICRHLEPRRLVTTELHVLGPVYVPIWVSVGVSLVPGRDTTEVTTAVSAAIRRFLSPLEGGFADPATGRGAGWPLGRGVDRAELAAVAARVDGVAKVTGIVLATGASVDPQTIDLFGRELPQLAAVEARVGDPMTIDELRGQRPSEPVQRRPVPVLPEAC